MIYHRVRIEKSEYSGKKEKCINTAVRKHQRLNNYYADNNLIRSNHDKIELWNVYN